MQIRKLLCVSTACLALAACSGGGGGGGAVSTLPAPSPSPTPTPTPAPSGTNSALTGTLVSETFATDASTGTVNYPKSGAPGTASAAVSTISVAYDAATSSYTITAGSRSQQFGPANIDASTTGPQITVYKRVSGTTTDTLTLTKPGTSGSLTYQYVGAGFWQRTIDGTTAVSGTIDSFVYGVRTPATAVPRTGSASYAVDLLGSQAYLDQPVSLRGTGTMSVRFGENSFSLSGSYNEINPSTGAFNGSYGFNGSGTLSSTANSLSGTMQMGIIGQPLALTGAINGRFFGPAAEEVGAAFQTSNSQGLAATGAIIGRRADGAGIGNLATATTFDTYGTSMGYTVNGSGRVVGFAGSNSADAPLSFRVDPAAGTRTVQPIVGSPGSFGTANLVASAGVPNFSVYRVTSGTRTDELLLYTVGASNTQLVLSYASFGQWRAITPGSTAGTSNVLDRFFAYGERTSTGVAPVTGSARYDGVLFGRAVAFNGIMPMDSPQWQVGGTIRLDINFAARTYTGTLNPTLTDLSSNITTPWQAFALGGTYNPSAAGALNGAVFFGQSLNGRLYGPNAEEAAGDFYVNAPFGAFTNVLSVGVFGARRN